jgi:hypothetical protein
MFEACAFDLPSLTNSKNGFDDHEERADFLRSIGQSPMGITKGLVPKNPLHEMASAYQALYGLSRRARYLVHKRNAPVNPVRMPDLKVAVESFQKVKGVIESVYAANGKKPGWLQDQLIQ